MKCATYFSAIVISALLSTTSLPAVSNASQENLAGRLRDGNVVVYFRHGHTRGSVSRMDGCESERNPSDLGREEMRLVNSAFQKLGTAVSEVLSSPFCRARETAIIGSGKAEVSETLTSVLGESADASRIPELLHLLASPQAGTVRVIVAHYSNLMNALGISLEEGEAAIFAPPPGAGDRLQLLGRVKPGEWSNVVAFDAPARRSDVCSQKSGATVSLRNRLSPLERIQSECPRLAAIVEKFVAQDLGEAFPDRKARPCAPGLAEVAAFASAGDAKHMREYARYARAAGATRYDFEELVYLTTAYAGVDRGIEATRALWNVLNCDQET
jgi:phosphohistidine phosphatase SixA